MTAPILSKEFKYTNAADSSKPGYLKAKFDRIRRELKEQTEKAAQQPPVRRVK